MSSPERELHPHERHQLVTIALLQDILDELRKPEEWGSTGDIERIYWDPASNLPTLGPTAEWDYDGIYRSIGIFNLSAGLITVSFTGGFSKSDRSSLLTLSARGFIVLPYRGSHVSVSGAAAGSALIVAFDVPQPVNAGTF